jgi:hypothetical protein
MITYKTSDKTSLQLLVHFFTAGNVSNVSTTLQYQREKKARAPCLFAVPRSLWKDTDGPDGRELVMGGTCAMVFRVSFNKLGELLEEVSKSENDLFWEDFLDIEGEKLKEQAEEPNNGRKVYLKVRTRDTTAHFQENFFEKFYNLLKRRNVDEKDTDLLASVKDFLPTS